jgi:hypothetical protein
VERNKLPDQDIDGRSVTKFNFFKSVAAMETEVALGERK